MFSNSSYSTTLLFSVHLIKILFLFLLRNPFLFRPTLVVEDMLNGFLFSQFLPLCIFVGVFSVLSLELPSSVEKIIKTYFTEFCFFLLRFCFFANISLISNDYVYLFRIFCSVYSQCRLNHVTVDNRIIIGFTYKGFTCLIRLLAKMFWPKFLNFNLFSLKKLHEIWFFSPSV